MPIARDPSRDATEDLTEPTHALEHFTDREAALTALQGHLEAPEGAPLPVLSFYGVGGVGKSLLVRKIVADLRESSPAVPVGLVDFSDVRARDRVYALTSLRLQLGRKAGVPCPGFDLVRAVLAAKEGGAEEDLFLANPALKKVVPALKATAIVAGLPGVGLVSAGVDVGNRLLDIARKEWPWLERKLREAGGTAEVLELRRLEPEQLVDRLARALAGDLTEGLPARPGKACRAMIVFDTYERLWSGKHSPTAPQGAEVDAWVRALYGYLCYGNRILLVIAGRDALAWPEVDPDWQALSPEERSRYLEGQLLGGLSPADAQRYLARCGVGRPPETDGPTPLQTAIIDCTQAGSGGAGCLPFYVGLCANIVHNERRGAGADPPADSFQTVPAPDLAARLSNRFLDSLVDPALAELVRTLSLVRWFDLELLGDRLRVGDDAARATYRTLTHFSFVEPAGEGALRLHAVMREALQYQARRADPDWFGGCHQWCHGHWSARHAGGEPRAEAEAWYHLLQTDPGQAVADWCHLAEAAVSQRDGARGRALVSWWDGLDLTTEAWRGQMGEVPWASALRDLAVWLAELRPFLWQPAVVLERCIRCHQAALEVFTESAHPSEWATVQNRLGGAYGDLPTGDRAANSAQAIACFEASLRVWTEAAFPSDWARSQNNLGLAYASVPTGDPGASLHRAIACYEAALRVWTEEAFPADWSAVHNNLGIAYADLPTGDRGANLQRAIASYEAALRVCTAEAFPADWALTQNNLGIACWGLRVGDREANLQRAIACYEAALRVWTEEAFPAHWAGTQNNLGLAYQDLRTGDRGANLQRAMACYEAALRVWTEAAFPGYWAMAQNNLGLARQRLSTGDAGANVQRAIACFEAALRVCTEEASPARWATMQNNLGTAYLQLPTGDRGANRQQAIACFEAALRVRTPEAFPTDRAETTYNLACALALAGDTEEALGQLAQAIAFDAATYQPLAAAEEDLASLRAEDRFQRLVAGSSTAGDSNGSRSGER